MINKEKEWFALMNKDGMFFENEKIDYIKGQYTVWGSSPRLRNKKATRICLKKMQKKYGGKIVRFIKQNQRGRLPHKNRGRKWKRNKKMH